MRRCLRMRRLWSYGKCSSSCEADPTKGRHKCKPPRFNAHPTIGACSSCLQDTADLWKGEYTEEEFQHGHAKLGHVKYAKNNLCGGSPCEDACGCGVCGSIAGRCDATCYLSNLSRDRRQRRATVVDPDGLPTPSSATDTISILAIPPHLTQTPRCADRPEPTRLHTTRTRIAVPLSALNHCRYLRNVAGGRRLATHLREGGACLRSRVVRKWSFLVKFPDASRVWRAS